jgi:hypothetical protein
VIIYTRIINNINLQNLKRAAAFIDINERKVDQVNKQDPILHIIMFYSTKTALCVFKQKINFLNFSNTQ